MINITMAQAKHDFRIGYLNKYRIEKAPVMLHGWLLILGEGNSLGVLVNASRKEQRLFKSLDGAVAVLEDIGFKVEVLS